MKLSVWAILAAAAALGAMLLLLGGPGNGLSSPVSGQREVLGAQATITVYDRSPKLGRAAIDQALDRMRSIETVASAEDSTSELGQLHQTDYLPSASSELTQMLRLAFVVHQISDGAFDITGKPLLELWQAASPGEVQTASLALASEHVGMTRILLGQGANASVALVPGTRIDLNGIAQGTAVDAAIAALQEAGIEHALVQLGAAYRAYGGMPDGTPWRVTLAGPDGTVRTVAQFDLRDGALATVGTPARFFDAAIAPELIVDPRTGCPAKAMSSATVIASTCAEACALARAVFVLGPDAGLALIERFASNQALLLGYDDPTSVLRSSGMTAVVDP